MRNSLAYHLPAALAVTVGVCLLSLAHAQRGGNSSAPPASAHPFIADLKASYGSDVYTDFLYDARMTPHTRSVHRIYMARALGGAGEFEMAERILDQITTYEDLSGSDPVHLRAEELQMEMRQGMALAESDPERRRQIYRPLIYYALGRIRAFRDPETRRRIAEIGLSAARYNMNEEAIERFTQILDGLRQ